MGEGIVVDLFNSIFWGKSFCARFVRNGAKIRWSVQWLVHGRFGCRRCTLRRTRCTPGCRRCTPGCRRCTPGCRRCTPGCRRCTPLRHSVTGCRRCTPALRGLIGVDRPASHRQHARWRLMATPPFPHDQPMLFEPPEAVLNRAFRQVDVFGDRADRGPRIAFTVMHAIGQGEQDELRIVGNPEGPNPAGRIKAHRSLSAALGAGRRAATSDNTRPATASLRAQAEATSAALGHGKPAPARKAMNFRTRFRGQATGRRLSRVGSFSWS